MSGQLFFNLTGAVLLLVIAWLNYRMLQWHETQMSALNDIYKHIIALQAVQKDVLKN